MEIIVLPYMAISFSIAWAIFSPFAQVEDVYSMTFSKIEIGDLFGLFLPASLFLAASTWLLPLDVFSIGGSTLIIACAFGCSVASLVGGSFLFSKLEKPSALKRIAVIGVIIPLGSLLSIAWFAIPLVAFSNSVFLTIPGTIMIVPVTLVLRTLSTWVCSDVLGMKN